MIKLLDPRPYRSRTPAALTTGSSASHRNGPIGMGPHRQRIRELRHLRQAGRCRSLVIGGR
jgi:hypothetical protein